MPPAQNSDQSTPSGTATSTSRPTRKMATDKNAQASTQTSTQDAQASGTPQPTDRSGCAFFYGTLMLPEVFYSVCYGSKNVPEDIKSRHTFTRAILHGYCRRRVKHANYPGIIRDKDHDVIGIFATGLSRANMDQLDRFEGSQYECKTRSVTLLQKVKKPRGDGYVLVEGEKMEAQVYVFRHKSRLENREWHLEDFRSEILGNYSRG